MIRPLTQEELDAYRVLGGIPLSMSESEFRQSICTMASKSLDLDREGVVVPRAHRDQRLRDAIETLRKAMPSSERFVYLRAWQRINSALYDDAAAPQENQNE